MTHGPDLFTAIKANDPILLQKLIEDGADIETRDDDGNTPLMAACGKGTDPKIALELLRRGADAKVRNRFGGTPLLSAVFWKRSDLVSALIVQGADVDAAGALDLCMASMTPLGIAVLDGALDIARLLLDAGADVNGPDGEGRTPVFFAATASGVTSGQLELLKILLERKADVNVVVGYEKRTPLLEACRYPATCAEAIRALLDAGADVHAADSGGNTALHFALIRGMGPVHHDIIRLLVGRGARIDAANMKGDTPLDMALRLEDREPARIMENARR